MASVKVHYPGASKKRIFKKIKKVLDRIKCECYLIEVAASE